MNLFQRFLRPQKLTKQDVLNIFNEMLGRPPESDAVLAAHLQLADRDTLRKVIEASAEYQLRQKHLAEHAGPPAAEPAVEESALFSHPTANTQPAPLPDRPMAANGSVKLAFIGNCQSVELARLANAMNPAVTATAFELLPATLERIVRPKNAADAIDWLAYDQIWVHPHHQLHAWQTKQAAPLKAKIRTIPTIDTLGFHPDCVYATVNGVHLTGPLGPYQSALVLWAWRNNLPAHEAVQLFNDDVFEFLGYHDLASAGEASLIKRGHQAQVPVDTWLAQWTRRGCWMHTINHPKLHVLADLAAHCLHTQGLDAAPDTADAVDDGLAQSPVWPVYPEVAARLGLQGAYSFRPARKTRDTPAAPMGLQAFVEASYAALAAIGKGTIVCSRLDTVAFKGLAAWLQSRAASAATSTATAQPTNPYSALPDHQFWRRAIEKVAPADVDPVLSARFAITPSDKVGTAGSCFAQHIARTLSASGFNYFVTENDDNLAADEQLRRNYGVFSARFGNVYTARQLLQLQRLALGHSPTPPGLVLQRADGRFVDALRPYIEPDGFDSPAAVEASRQVMLHSVRRLLTECDVFVFTLGLTEAWRSTAHGTVFPIAPGVVTPHAARADFEFVNFTADETITDMTAFLLSLKAINPKVRVVLTVSPVPLMATFEPRSVLASTTYSKAVLRVAAQTLAQRFNWVDYFASFEVITGGFNRGRYFDTDLRSVTDEGVAHVMRLFMRHYAGQGAAQPATAATQRPLPGSQATNTDAADTRALEQQQEAQAVSAVICDEERLDDRR